MTEKEGLVMFSFFPDREEKMALRDWLSPVIVKPLIISIGLMVFQQFSGINAVLFNAASIFKEAGFTNSKLVTISVGLIQFVGTGLACLIMDKAGRRILLLIMAVGMCVTLVGLGFYFEILARQSVEASKISWLSILCIVLFNLAFSLAWGPVPWLVMSEIFPLRARGPASSIATLSNWLLAFIVTKTFPTMQAGLTVQGTYWFFGGWCFVGFVFVYFLLPETKGKTLEEIEALFDKKKHSYQQIE